MYDEWAGSNHNKGRNEMNEEQGFQSQDPEMIRDILLGSGYSQKAIDYYLTQPNMGKLDDANQVTELTGHCGDTMKLFLKIKGDRIDDAKIQVLGCPGAISAAMVLMEMIKGRTLNEAEVIKDRDIYRVLEELPDQKQHCIRLSVKTLAKAIEEYRLKGQVTSEVA